MKFAQWARSHRRSILFLLFVLALAGAASIYRMPNSLFPQVSFPRIVVSLDAGDRSAEQMVTVITQRVEAAIRSVPGVREIRSTTSRGTAELSINFNWGRPMGQALLQVEAAMNRVLSTLPPNIAFKARRMDPTVFPVAAYSLTSDSISLIKLRDISLYQILPLLSSIDGVAKVTVLGGQQLEYQIDVDAARLTALGLSIADVVKAVTAANVLTAVGRMEDKYKLFLLTSDSRFRDIKQIRSTVLKSGANGVVQLDDIATVHAGTVPSWLSVSANGREAVSVRIYQQIGGNTLKIVKNIRAELARFKSKLPAGVNLSMWYDQSDLIAAAAKSVRDAILIGVVMAALVLLLFLRSVKITVIAIVTVPVVLATTGLMLALLGMSLNIMTLGGMAAAIGLIVDDSIVMIEHIIRRVRGSTSSHSERIRLAASELARPLAGSSASTVIIFVPLAFLSGVTGAFFKALSLTMATSLVVSFLFAWLVVPLLADHLVGAKDARRQEPKGREHAILRGYRRIMRQMLARKWLLSILLIPLIAGGYLAYRNVGTGFMPHMDEGGFILDYRAPAGTSLAETNRLLRQVEVILKSIPEIASYSRRTGAGLGGTLTEANEGDFFIRLKAPPRRAIDLVMNEVRSRVEGQVPGLKIEMAQLMQDLIGDLTAVPQPIEIKLYGDDSKVLRATAGKVAQAISGIQGVVEIRDGIVMAGDSLNIELDHSKMALEGINPESVTRQLSEMISGVVATKMQSGIKLVGVRVWMGPGKRDRLQRVMALRLRASDGHLFPLRRVARVRTITGQPQIVRDNLKQMLAVTGRITGRDLGSTVLEVRRILKRPGLIPKGIYFELGGLYKQQQIAFRGLLMVFVTAVLLVFLLLLFIYERFRIAVSVMTVPLLASAAVFIGLWVTNIELNITAMMGMTMVVGIATEVAIFYFSEYESLVAGGMDGKNAVVEAGVNRLRPIAMTTLAAILALLPLGFALGQGSAMQQPLAVAIISGLMLQMPLVLIVMPVVFSLFRSKA